MNNQDFQFVYDEKNKGYVLTNYFGQDKVVLIPNELAQKPVVGIQDTFQINPAMSVLILGKNITSISKAIFSNNDDLSVYSYNHMPDLSNNVTYRDDLVGLYEDDDVVYALFKDKTAIVIDNRLTESRKIGFGKYGRMILITDIVNNDYSVIGIHHSCFKDAFNLKKILIPNSVKWIGKEAFMGCSMLEDLLITSDTIDIHDEAFSDCQSLRKVEIFSEISLMGKWVFKDSVRATLLLRDESDVKFQPEWNIDQNLVYYGYMDLKEDSNLTYALFKNQTAVILSYANDRFEHLNIRPFIIHDNVGYRVTEIAPYAFYQAIYLTSVYIPYSIQKIHDMAFAFSHIKEIHIPHELDYIGRGVFYNCIYLEKLQISNNIKIIPANFAAGCQSLHTVHLGESITILGESCFQDCHSLCQLILPNTLETIEPMSLYGTQIAVIVLGSKVNSIGDLAFQHNHNLRTVVIGDPGCLIGEHLFDNHNDIKLYIMGPEGSPLDLSLEKSKYDNMKVYNEAKSIVTIEGVIYLLNEFDTAYVVGHDDFSLKGNTIIREYVENQKVTHIEASAFYGSKTIESLYVPDSIIKLQSNFIGNCPHLKHVSIPNHFETIEMNWNTGLDMTNIENRLNYPKIRESINNKK